MGTRVDAELSHEEAMALRCVFELESQGHPALRSLTKIHDLFWRAETVGDVEPHLFYIPLWDGAQRGIHV